MNENEWIHLRYHARQGKKQDIIKNNPCGVLWHAKNLIKDERCFCFRNYIRSEIVKAVLKGDVSMKPTSCVCWRVRCLFFGSFLMFNEAFNS